MGGSSSRIEKSEALRLCKERKRFIKQAIDSRYALSAAHLSYVQSLRSIGIALRRFAEAEAFIESSLSTSPTELDKTPSHSSYPSPSPSHNAETLDSPLHSESPLSPPPLLNLSYMRSCGNAAVTVRLDPSFMEDEILTFPPPPPPPESGSSWDFFDPTDEKLSFRFIGVNGFNQNFDNVNGLEQFGEEEVVSFMEESREKSALKGNSKVFLGSIRSESEQRAGNFSGNSAARSKDSVKLLTPNVHCFSGTISERCEDVSQTPVGEGKLVNRETLEGCAALEQSNSNSEKLELVKDFCEEREDPSEFITHRAKDFLSSIKDIEHRFFRASESGKEVSRMLEANKIRLSCSEAKERSPASVFVTAFRLACCRKRTIFASNEPPHHVGKVITWNRSTSSQSSSSKNPLTSASKDDIDDSGSDFLEEFCMIAGSHSSTLDRLYAWERKLYDEVKAIEFIRKEYDQKCNQLKHQFARDVSTQVIDKTRAVVKDLHSRIKVALHAVDLIAKRTENLRDEELQPQLIELIQGLIRMWKAMLECHHAQYITISLAYHTKSSTGQTQEESHRQVLVHLLHEIECFGSSFADLIDAHKSYVEALNSWLQNCILLPQERSKGRRAFSPRRALAPPIFVLCRDWSVGIKTLPSGELTDAIKAFVSDLHSSVVYQEEQQKKLGPSDSDNNGESESKQDEKYDRSLTLRSIQTSLTKVLDRLTKFTEASLKLCEDIRQGCEAARMAYANCRTNRL